MENEFSSWITEGGQASREAKRRSEAFTKTLNVERLSEWFHARYARWNRTNHCVVKNKRMTIFGELENTGDYRRFWMTRLDLRPYHVSGVLATARTHAYIQNRHAMEAYFVPKSPAAPV